MTYLIIFSPTVSDISTSYFQRIQRRTNLNSIPVEKFTKILAITYTTPFLTEDNKIWHNLSMFFCAKQVNIWLAEGSTWQSDLIGFACFINFLTF